MVYSEPELIIPALRLLKEHSSGLRMSKIIKELTIILKPIGHDLEIIENRKDTYFSQKVRNLKSHDTLTRKGFAIYDVGIFKITTKGLEYLEENEPIQVSLIEQGFKPETIEKEAENDYRGIIIEEGALQVKSIKQRERSQKLRKAKIEELKKVDGKIKCIACDFDFSEKYGEYGKDYIIIHHIETVHEMDIEGNRTKLIEALKKVVPLCSNCHDMVHHKRGKMLSIDELKEIIKSSSS